MTTFDETRVLTRHEFFVPRKVRVNGSHLSWSEVLPATDQRETVVGDLLKDFLKLESATPDEMATFLEVYGVPEICQHGYPDRHKWAWAADKKVRDMPKEPYCRFAEIEGQPAIWSVHVQQVARAFASASRLGVALSVRHEGDEADWLNLQDAVSWHWGPSSLDGDWTKRRDVLADWLTDVLRGCGVATLARWTPRTRLTVIPEADGLIGTVALALAHEVGQRDGFLCSVCGTAVDRVRPPREGEQVYCSKLACKREQQRRNQAKWRAKKTSGKGDD